MMCAGGDKGTGRNYPQRSRPSVKFLDSHLLDNPGQTEMTLTQLCLAVNAKRLDATARRIDQSVSRPQLFFSVVRVFAELDGVVFVVPGRR